MESIKEACSQAEVNWECSEEGIDVQALGKLIWNRAEERKERKGARGRKKSDEESRGMGR
jgi:hypothetical protein